MEQHEIIDEIVTEEQETYCVASNNKAKPKGKKIGRTPHTPTDETIAQVKHMADLGLPQYQIAKKMDMDTKTLRKHYPKELSCAGIDTNLKVLETLYDLAVNQKHATCLIFWAKTRCGFSADQPALANTAAPSAKREALKPKKKPPTKSPVRDSDDESMPFHPRPEDAIRIFDQEGNRIG